MTGKNAEEKEVPIKAYLYNKKKRMKMNLEKQDMMEEKIMLTS
jgi:hypothetical protein